MNLESPIFRVAAATYTWHDVLATAEFLTPATLPWEPLCRGIACARIAERRGMTLDERAVQAAANELRYALHLITAEETEEWLRRHELTLDDVNEFLRRQLWLSQLGDEIPSTPRGDFTAVQIAPMLWPHVVLSGQATYLIGGLLFPAAAAEGLFKISALTTAELETARREFCQACGLAADDLELYVEGCLFLRGCFDCQLRLHAFYRKCCANAGDQEALATLLTTLRTELVRVRFESVAFPSLEAAKEAYLCITADGESVAAIVSRTGARYAHSESFLRDLAPTVRPALLTAGIGECIAPRDPTDNNECCIYRIIDKIQPAVGDPLIRAELQRQYSMSVLGPYIRQSVQWLGPGVDLIHERRI